MLDANGQALGVPWPTITEVETTNEINSFGVPVDVVKKVLDKYPYFLSAVDPQRHVQEQQGPGHPHRHHVELHGRPQGRPG